MVELGRLHRTVAADAAYWAQPRGEAGALLYVARGDSAAQGIGASRPERGYVGLVAQRLRDTTGRPVQVVNLSRSGARIADVLERQLPELAALGRTPDLLTVAIGGNDVRAYDRATFARAADRLTGAAGAAGAAEAAGDGHAVRGRLVPPERPRPPGLGRRLLGGGHPRPSRETTGVTTAVLVIGDETSDRTRR